MKSRLPNALVCLICRLVFLGAVLFSIGSWIVILFALFALDFIQQCRQNPT